MKNIFKLIGVVAISGSMFFQSCETIELDLREDPNALSPSQASPDFLLNGIQEDFARFVESMGETGAEMTRIDYMAGLTYRDVYTPANFDNEWTSAYAGMFTDIQFLEPLAEEGELNIHLGIANFIKAYTLVTLVDYFGDVPFSQANLGGEEFNPAVDDGASVYASAIERLDAAIAAFNAGGPAPENDFFYDGDATKWVRACNTLKLKMYLSTRTVDSGAIAAFNGIISSGNYITDTADDLQFRWGTNAVQPDVRHPRYVGDYTPSGAGEYQANHQMNYMSENNDPRLRYYYYRQNEETPGAEAPGDLETLDCSLEFPPAHYFGFPFCSLENGYWGRDHGNADGIPPDTFSRTIHGVYPAGGNFDDSTFDGQVLGDGAGGNGVTPVLLASWVDFMRGEIALAGGDAASARTFLLAGLSKSVAKAISFGTLDADYDGSFEPTAAEISNHAAAIGDAFDNDSTGGWNVLGQEFFTALFGNGNDAYNFYRRTGFPDNLQPNIEPNPGAFIRSLFYSSNFVNNNSAVTQKDDVTVQVFWDNNPAAGFPLSN